MKIYWTFKAVPEFSGLSRAERRRVHLACYGQAFKSRRCLVALLICGLCGGVGSGLGDYLPSLLGFEHSMWQPTIGGCFGGGVGGFIWAQIATDYLRPYYANYIKSELQRVAA